MAHSNAYEVGLAENGSTDQTARVARGLTERFALRSSTQRFIAIGVNG
ncbi:MAG: hypothetical protein PVH21_03205 [Myxococcales bacterium]